MTTHPIQQYILSKTIKLKRAKIFLSILCLIGLSAFILHQTPSNYNLSRLTSTSNASSATSESTTAKDATEDVPENIPEKRKERKSDGPINRDGKPIMHTFFEPVPGGCCGATLSAHENLLNAWKESWKKNGWDTRILTTEDAKLHPKFEKLERILEALHVDPYNRRCFYRWLAMAALSDGVDRTGGGWMSDYDTFPLEININDGKYLPNGGTFTSFEFSVPSLISASSSEWDRLVDLFLETLPIHKGYKTDMWVLDTIRVQYGSKAGVFIKYKEEVVQGFHYWANDPTKVNCGDMPRMKAVHLSHESTDRAIQTGTFPLHEITDLKGSEGALEHRGEAAIAFLDDWRRQCRGQKVIEK